ncbi:uncharacterized protein BX664DRAFT_338547 [Halteromyces radiatus]|uniref:uncharacterized protein n=1 Tax=Halteromyces radiatus TaxID=101107 RepID=UPI00222046C8|nr:uncharacterized protein BX664DRAFT_338547 [Halteromyces radiatus]KAI8085113.1 hypothetical protein BX664DRAFT_338547 [Halteromyces radiatus]
MQRSIKAASQEDEISNIDAHLEYIKKALRWSINDLERFINLLRARVNAEELYVKSLSQISRLSTISEPEACPYFGQEQSTYELATFQYEISLDKVINSRRDFIQAMKSQIDVLVIVKDKQEQRRKTVKQHVADKNMDYTLYRTRDFVKAKKMYFGKCNELAFAQQQFHDNTESLTDHGLSPTPTDEPRKSIENDNDTDGSSISSIPDTTQNSTTTSISGNRKKMGGFMAQMRTQIAAATAGTNDLSKQNARFAKIKKDIHDTDHEYRQGVRHLEKLRKTQIETMNQAMKHVEVVFLDKAEATRSVLTTILNNEHAALLRETSLIQHNKSRADAVDPQLDVSLFKTEYQKKHFTQPEQIYYENYYNGVYKDVLFGASLDEYAMEHQRTVPLVVSKCIEAIEQLGGLQKEGIYRISGRQTNVDALKAEFEKNEEVFQPQTHYDVFTIASVLKIYLRELKIPLCPYSVSDRMTYSTVQNTQQRISFLQHKVSELSQPRRDTLEAVVRHLEKVNAHSDTNKMNIQNLSYMFTPAIFHDHNQAEHPGEWRSDLMFEDLILHHDAVFAPISRQQPISSPPTPLAHGDSSDFKDSLTGSDQASGPNVPIKSATNNISASTQQGPPTINKPSPPPPSTSTTTHPPSSSSMTITTTTTTTTTIPPSNLTTAQIPMAKTQSFTLPIPSAGGTSLAATIESIGLTKTHSTPSTPTTTESAQKQQPDLLDSASAPSSLPMSTSSSASTEQSKPQGLLRRATLKARSAIPPRQQSLRLKHGRSTASTTAEQPISTSSLSSSSSPPHMEETLTSVPVPLQDKSTVIDSSETTTSSSPPTSLEKTSSPPA